MKSTFLLLFINFFLLSCCDNIKLVRQEDKPEQKTDASLKKGKELVKINDTTIHEGYLDFLARINPRVKGQINNPASRKKIIDNLVEQELLYQESVKRGLDKNEDVVNKAALYRRVVIAQALLEEEMEKKVKEYFEKNKETQFTKVAFSQIQIDFKKPEEEKPAGDKKEKKKKEEAPPTPEEKAAALKSAQAIKARLAAGEDFAKVAEETSDDKSSKKKGGDMGKISRDDKRMARLGLDSLTQAAFTLKKGDVSDPLETAKGYHIIKVTSDVEVTPFEEAERVIRMQIQQETKDSLLAQLKGSGKINYAEGEKEETKKEDGKKEADKNSKPPEPKPTESLSDEPQPPVETGSTENAPTGASPMASPPPMAVPPTPPAPTPTPTPTSPSPTSESQPPEEETAPSPTDTP